jgi:signal transduction histidine kinase
LNDLTRFNESVDQALGEGIVIYTKKVDQSRDLLLAVLGHDLRNPLGAILLAARSLVGSENSDEKNVRAAKTVLNSGARMQQLISDLLDFSSTRLGKRLPLARSPADLADVCEQTSAEVRALHPDRDVVLQLAGDLNGSWDRARIAQMLSNLLGNALQHGSASAAIVLAARCEGNDIILTVHNEGNQIPASELHAIFEPLYTAPKEKQEGKPGWGLGLHIARETARAHGGSIDVASSKEEGTTFTVRLPRR